MRIEVPRGLTTGEREQGPGLHPAQPHLAQPFDAEGLEPVRGRDVRDPDPLDLDPGLRRREEAFFHRIGRSDRELLTDDRVEQGLVEVRIPRDSEAPEPPDRRREDRFRPGHPVELLDRVVQREELPRGGPGLGRGPAPGPDLPPLPFRNDLQDPWGPGRTPRAQDALSVGSKDDRTGGVLDLFPLDGERAELGRSDIRRDTAAPRGRRARPSLSHRTYRGETG